MAGRGRFKDITGQKFKLWTVVAYSHSDNSNAVWVCQCECGSTKLICTNYLKGKGAKSCGCTLGKHRHTAGASGPTDTYRSWASMIGRCTRPSSPAFEHYQKKGITVCDRWRHGESGLSAFECFLADMGDRPTYTHTLDRINNDLGYFPGNVRWATRLEQANNRQTNLIFTYKGNNYTLADLARVTGTSKETLRSRLCRSKLPWTVEGAVETPKLPKTMVKAGFYR